MPLTKTMCKVVFQVIEGVSVERTLGACCYRHRCRRGCLDAGNALHLDVTARVANITLGGLLDVFLILLATTASRDGTGSRSLLGGDLDRLRLGWGGPSMNLPCDAGEGLKLEAAPVPLTAGLAGAVEST